MDTWPKITKNFTASNGWTIVPIGDSEAAVEHGRRMHNGLEVPGNIYLNLASAGTNAIYEVRSPDNRELASGSLKPGVNGESYVNFVRGPHNLDLPEGHPALVASQEWAAAINENRIEKFAEPVDGQFRKIQVAPQIPAPNTPQAPAPAIESWLSQTMGAFFRVVGLSQASTQVSTPETDIVPEAPPVDFIERSCPEDSWETIASPGDPDLNGLSVVVAANAPMLRHIAEECENRMMWEQSRVLSAVKRGEIQVAAIFDNNPNVPAPIVGYVVLRPQGGNSIIATDIVARFEKSPTPQMVSSVINWVGAVNGLAAGQANENGVVRHIDATGTHFLVSSAPDVQQQYNADGHLIGQSSYEPGRAIRGIIPNNPEQGAVYSLEQLERPSFERCILEEEHANNEDQALMNRLGVVRVADIAPLISRIGHISVVPDSFETWINAEDSELCVTDLGSGNFLPVSLSHSAAEEDGYETLVLFHRAVNDSIEVHSIIAFDEDGEYNLFSGSHALRNLREVTDIPRVAEIALAIEFVNNAANLTPPGPAPFRSAVQPLSEIIDNTPTTPAPLPNYLRGPEL